MLKKRKISIPGTLGFFLIVTIIGHNYLLGKSPFDTGKIIEEVKCLDSQQSYSLYLPANYTPDKKWSVLFFLEPGARSKLPLERFKEAADKYGYILVCSRQFQNGPYEPNARAMLAMWQDVHKRFALDLSRRYASGFSGGARGASRLHFMTGKPLAGIIACGAGLDTGLKPQHIPPAFYISTIGLEDFNYKEMMNLEGEMDKQGVNHIILVTGDYHRWPDIPVCTRTVEWLELQAMKNNSMPTDAALVNTLYQKELNIAKELESQGKLYRAARGYKACVLLFKGLREVTEAESGKERIINTKAYKAFQKDEKRRLQQEWQYISHFAMTVKKIETSPVTTSSVKKSINELRIPYLRKIAEKSKNNYEASWAYRLLSELFIKFSRAGSIHLGKNEYQRAILYLELAFAASKRNYYVPYQLAQTYSLNGKKNMALKYLRIAVERGFDQLSQIKSDQALDSLREEKEFKDLILQMQQEKKSTQ